jgi:NAD(P)-dependent dehydrogenase (short-subunit alcohol dehydrogenase family)
MKSQRMMSTNFIPWKWGRSRGASPLQQIATDPRTWILAGALASAGGRALGRWRTRYDLRNRTVLVTGGTRGLGLELARQAGLAGARVAICGRDSDTLARARENLSGMGMAALALTCDVSDRHQVAELIRSVHTDLGPIDVLINNAGMVDVGPVGVLTRTDFERDMATNFWGPLNVILAVLPHMRPRGEGRIVNIASIGGKVSVPHLLPYSSSKFALVGLSEGLRAELRASGILVTTVCPGLMRTGSPEHATFKGRHDAEYTWFSLADNLPLLSMDVERAARRILNAMRHGKSHVVLSLPAKVADKIHGLFPGLTSDALGLANRLLPGIESDKQGVEGQHCRPVVSVPWLGARSDRVAAQRNQTSN